MSKHRKPMKPGPARVAKPSAPSYVAPPVRGPSMPPIMPKMGMKSGGYVKRGKPC